MSLISQNAGSKNRFKGRREDPDEPAFMEGDNKEDVGRREYELGLSSAKKRRKEKEEKLEIEEGREMRNLEDFLFGSLYTPLEFGKDEEEMARVGDMTGSALFFVNRSANSALSVYEEDAEFSDRSDDDEETKQRKAVWVDEEEEKTTVTIAKVNRLRKLRKEEDESLISGPEYIARLRAHYTQKMGGLIA